MTSKEDIIRMAREAGAWSQQKKNCEVEYVMSAESLERFAELVRADEREACLVGIQAEIDHAHLNKLRLTPLFGQRQGEIAVRASSLDSALYAIRARATNEQV